MKRDRISARREAIERAAERFRAVVRAHGQRWTAERQAIVEVIAGLEGHFGVEALVGALQARSAGASRSTLYRALPLLLEAGLLVPIGRPGEQQEFEAGFGHEHHDHLVCQRCGKVVEFHFEAIEILQRAVAEQHDFELTGHRHELIGLCGACRRSG